MQVGHFERRPENSSLTLNLMLQEQEIITGSGHKRSRPVADLAPLKGMPLTFLIVAPSRVSDLSPLLGMPLKELSCPFTAARDAPILRSIKTLEKINGKPAVEFWKEVDAKKP